mmetsp:Transcript_37483/g.87758  ORF Transcript_37483/g.87758 Transcript_37483/m.87758 type:complete len:276 (-) Transcript_37483:32-859(-)
MLRAGLLSRIAGLHHICLRLQCLDRRLAHQVVDAADVRVVVLRRVDILVLARTKILVLARTRHGTPTPLQPGGQHTGSPRPDGHLALNVGEEGFGVVVVDLVHSPLRTLVQHKVVPIDKVVPFVGEAECDHFLDQPQVLLKGPVPRHVPDSLMSRDLILQEDAEQVRPVCVVSRGLLKLLNKRRQILGEPRAVQVVAQACRVDPAAAGLSVGVDVDVGEAVPPKPQERLVSAIIHGQEESLEPNVHQARAVPVPPPPPLPTGRPRLDPEIADFLA